MTLQFQDALDAYEQAVKAVYVLLVNSTGEEHTLTCPYSGWTPLETLAHLIDAETTTHLHADREPPASVQAVRQEMVDGVQSRAKSGPATLLNEYRSITRKRLRALRSLQVTETTDLPHPYCPVLLSAADLVRWRTCDTWLHTEDIRSAMQLPPDVGSLAYQASKHFLAGFFNPSDTPQSSNLFEAYELYKPSPVAVVPAAYDG